jgi:hypothetical protein
MATMTREEQIKQKEEQLLGIFGKRMKWAWIKSPEDLWFSKSDLMRGMERLWWWFLSLMTFSPETTILNISSSPELLNEYIVAIFEWLNKTTNNKLADELFDILVKIDTEDSEKTLSNFIYDITLYFNQNPITIEDSDPAYSSFMKAEQISKKFTKGKYQIVNQESQSNSNDIKVEDIDLKKLVDLLNKDKASLAKRDILKIIINLYGNELFEEKFSELNNN